MGKSKVIFNGNTIFDLTGVTATVNTVAEGKTFHSADGESRTGQMGSINLLMIGNKGYLELPSSLASISGTTLTIDGIIFNVPSWSSGTDAQIAQALDYHYRGIINLHDYWNVGDEREVTVSAMSAYKVGNTTIVPAIASQTVKFVLTEKGGKELVTPIGANTECAFQVDQKNCLNEAGITFTAGYQLNAGGWNVCPVRTWCNTTYKNALPATFSSLFKEIVNPSNEGYQKPDPIDVNDYFALRSRAEIFNDTPEWASIKEGTQVEYYKTSSNRTKGTSSNPSGSVAYWERTTTTPWTDYTGCANSQYGYDGAYNKYHFYAPFGAI